MVPLNIKCHFFMELNLKVILIEDNVYIGLAVSFLLASKGVACKSFSSVKEFECWDLENGLVQNYFIIMSLPSCLVNNDDYIKSYLLKSSRDNCKFLILSEENALSYKILGSITNKVQVVDKKISVTSLCNILDCFFITNNDSQVFNNNFKESDALTKAEVCILRLLIRCKNINQISLLMGCKTKTVHSHISNIAHKCSCKNTLELKLNLFGIH